MLAGSPHTANEIHISKSGIACSSSEAPPHFLKNEHEPMLPTTGFGKWFEHPHNTWAFQNAGMLVCTDTISRDARWRDERELKEPLEDGVEVFEEQPTPIWVLPRSIDPALPQHRFRDMTGTKLPLHTILQHSNVDAFFVMKEGEVKCKMTISSGQQPAPAPDSLHCLTGLTGFMMSFLAGIAIIEGVIDRSSCIAHYIPELQVREWARHATVGDIMSMTTDIMWDDELEDAFRRSMGILLPNPPNVYAPTMESFPDQATMVMSLESRKEEVKQHFEYKNVHFCVLGWIITRAYKLPWQQLLSEKIWGRLGASNSARCIVDEAGIGSGTFGVQASVEDVGRFGQMLLHKGTACCDAGGHGGVQVIPSVWFSDLLNDTREAYRHWNGCLEESMWNRPNMYFKDGVRVADDRKGQYFGFGEYGQFLYVDDARQTVIVMLGSHPVAKCYQQAAGHLALCEEIAEYLEDTKPRVWDEFGQVE